MMCQDCIAAAAAAAAGFVYYLSGELGIKMRCGLSTELPPIFISDQSMSDLEVFLQKPVLIKVFALAGFLRN